MRTLCKGLFIILLTCSPALSYAVTAYPFPLEVKQPNGEIITIRMHGDEHFHYMTTEDGYVIASNKDGYFTYAVISDEGRILPSHTKISDKQLRNSSTRFVRADSKEFMEKVKRPALIRTSQHRGKDLRSGSETVTGKRKGVIILVNFANATFKINNPQQSFSRMLNQSGYADNGATGSARDFYIDNSQGKFTPEFDVFGPVGLPNNIDFYGTNDYFGQDQNPQQMVIDACNAANIAYPSLNFADYDYNKDGELDNVFIFYAGYNEAEGGGANSVWPHKYSVWANNVKVDGIRLSDYACTSELKGNSGSSMSGIGTFTHEFGHVLGLPDLYDADGASNGQGTGIGNWNTMASGSYLNGGRTPPYFGAIERYLLGWLEPTLLTVPAGKETKTLNPIMTSGNNQVFRLNTPTNEEYYLFECRKRQGWDTYLPGEGMLVYHVDRTTNANKQIIFNETNRTVSSLDLWTDYLAPNIIGSHQCYELLRANNLTNPYSGNPFPGASNITSISDYTEPGFLNWDRKKTNCEISSITRNVTTGVISFNIQQKNESPIPTLSAKSTSKITQNSAQLNGIILDKGTDNTITEKGFCWNLSGNPTINDNTVKVSGEPVGNYFSSIGNLEKDTTYYWKAFVKTAANSIYYSDLATFNTLPNPMQVPYEQNFNNGLPNFWTTINGNNDNQTWQFYSKDWLLDNNIDIGSGAVVIIGNENTAEDWLISPQISIPTNAASPEFSFTVNYFSNETLSVRISETYTDTIEFKSLTSKNLEFINNTTNGIELTVGPISLNKYIGKKIFLAFVNKSTNAEAMMFSKFKLSDKIPTGTGDIKTSGLPIAYSYNKNIYFTNIVESFDVQIVDISGRIKSQFSIKGNTNREIKHSGIYFIRLTNKNQTYTYKLLIK